ncbi:MAG: multidrug ABC transporter ATP-binding protein [Candidatus Riflebacteria bacterium HGW-Riflebacteria-2]|jgi:ABC-2 type transport system ATP-binding protein|nr:MAG: multidrug ABC transporter ATP-binding protein [Candidatus Riflebacteria bacterium HGW-Riflebacteria-2]
MTQTVLELKNVSKVYALTPGSSKEAQGRRAAIDNVSLTLCAGQIYGFAGLNGAGKTTSIKAALGLIRPDSGSIELFGAPIDHAAFNNIGFCPEKPVFYETLTASEIVDFSGRLLNISADEARKKEILNKVGLYDDRHKRVGAFSKGMQQRLGIACAMLHDPALYILDEPASGLDPLGRRLVKDILKELKQAGKTVFFSTHIISDISEICDKIAIIHKGHILFEGGVDEFCPEHKNGEERFVKIVQDYDNKTSVPAAESA